MSEQEQGSRTRTFPVELTVNGATVTVDAELTEQPDGSWINIEPITIRAPAEPLQRIAAADQAVYDATDELRFAVRAARAAGHTWEQVGDALGVKKQTAWERFWPYCEQADREQP